MTPYEEMAEAIVQKFTLVLGSDIASARAHNVVGIVMSAEGRVETLSGDPTNDLESLVVQYQELLGPAALSFAKDATMPIIKKNPGLALPRTLQL